jgi:hypothetical protein
MSSGGQKQDLAEWLAKRGDSDKIASSRWPGPTMVGRGA